MRVTSAAIQPETTLTNVGYYFLGLGFLALARLKYAVSGYTPKPIRPWEIQRKIDHAIHVGSKFLDGLKRRELSVEGQDVLELGPGDDLGTGAYLLAKGARSYTAFDAHANAENTPAEFYARLRDRGLSFDPRALTLKVDPDFSLAAAFRPASFDLVLSNSAFEHFADPHQVLRELYQLVRPGGTLHASVDLQTHSRWIRQRDPNNIYRYPEWLYRLFRFPGQCNRLRMNDYRRFLIETGWSDIELRPGQKSQFQSRARLHSRFRDCDDLGVLAFTMCARRV